MLKIEEILTENGPLLSGEIKKILISSGLTEENARQKIFRSKKSINRLDIINFPRKEKFLFLVNQYKTEEFYIGLYNAFKKEIWFLEIL